MVYKSKDDSKALGIQLLDLTQIINELIDWRQRCRRDEWNDPVRVAMIDSFEDIILNSIVEEC